MSDESPILDAAKKLADPLIAKAEQAVPALVASWVALALAKGESILEDLPPALQPIARAALDHVQSAPAVVGALAQSEIVKIVHATAAGQGEQAEAVYLATSATNEERFKAQDDASAATLDEVEKRSKALQTVKGWAEDVVLAVTKAAILAAL